MDNTLIYGGEYEGPPYQFTTSVKDLSKLPRFGHESDFTALFSPYQDEQVDYTAGLISLFVFLLVFFIVWTIAIITFKVMGQTNAGFLSGHHFVVPDPFDDEKNIHKRPLRVRVVFLVATALLMTFSFLFVAKGLTNISSATTTMKESLRVTEEIINNAELIARNLEKVGDKSIEIRDAAVAELDDICPANPNIADSVGMDIMGIASQARSDLTMLANFIKDGVETMYESLALVRGFTDGADDTVEQIEFWDWEMKLLSAGLFILPAFIAVGVGLAMLDIDAKPYQRALTYVFMPLFAVTIIVCYIVCCALLPISAASADACSGGGNVRGGPDDTVLTVFRNLRGDDTGLIYQFVGFYTQQCRPEYHPFDFLSSYLNDLETAVDSTNTAVSAVQDNQALLEDQCGREFDGVLEIVKDMNDNLQLLQKQVDLTMDLVKCKNINQLYVNTVHEAGCTYSVDALAWTFASALVISICGLIMIMLRSSYYPVEYLELSEKWNTMPVPTKSESKDSADLTDPVAVKALRAEPIPEVAPPMFVPKSIKVSQENDEFEFELDPTTGEF
ncbi:hypothetical protein ACHAXR_003541 [Thalassiosira sp. AJA248-18]